MVGGGVWVIFLMFVFFWELPLFEAFAWVFLAVSIVDLMLLLGVLMNLYAAWESPWYIFVPYGRSVLWLLLIVWAPDILDPFSLFWP